MVSFSSNQAHPTACAFAISTSDDSSVKTTTSRTSSAARLLDVNPSCAGVSAPCQRVSFRRDELVFAPVNSAHLHKGRANKWGLLFPLKQERRDNLGSFGFTLLEVMVSLAILSVSLVAILNLHSGSVRVHNYSKHLTIATLLARSKMIDVEEHLLEEGLPEFNQMKEGTFEEEGYPGYAWTAEIVRANLGMEGANIEGLLGQALGFMGGGDSEMGGGMDGMLGGALGGMLGGNDAGGLAGMLGGGIEGMLQGQVQALLNTLEESVREVRLTIRWNDITGPSEFSVVTHIVRMEGQGAPGGAEERQRLEAQRAAEELQRQETDIRDAPSIPIKSQQLRQDLRVQPRMNLVPRGGR